MATSASEETEVIKKIAALIIGLFAVSQPLMAQTAATDSDIWIVYDRVASDGRPLVIFARTGNIRAQTLLQNGRATVVACRADAKDVDGNGMPQETKRLYVLEDRLADDPALREAGMIHLASVTGQGQRRIFFLHPEQLDLSQILQATPISGYSCDAEDVPDRLTLSQLVTPTAADIQLSGDQSVIFDLGKNGDDGSAARRTDFWFYGPRASLDLLAADLSTEGFTVERWLTGPDGVVLTRDMSITMSTFRVLTPIIVDAVQKSGVDYDGWETMVIAHGSTQP
ncbi:ribonuclease E inhibitor RraB [Cypionkella sinensis]|uniref:Ribonuclease E inhibitor RraB n=1 Tax=Cypionkella sinensis TaxID=1756043 RepID=A0ABV7IYE8_9RHOB